MSSIGTRAGVCSTFIPTPGGVCKLCGKREYQHTSEGAEVPIEVVKSKVPFIESIQPNVGSIKGGDEVLITGRNFSRIRYNKGLLWAKFGKYKVNLTMDSMGDVHCKTPQLLKSAVQLEDLKVSTGQHSESLYAIEVRLTADGGITWSNAELFSLNFTEEKKINYDCSKSYFWGGLEAPEKKKKHEKDKPEPTYDMFLSTTPKTYPHHKHSFTRACYTLIHYLHLATGRAIPKCTFDHVKHHVAEQTASYPYYKEMHTSSSGENKLALFFDIFLGVIEWDDILKSSKPPNPRMAAVVSWVKGGGNTNYFRKVMDRALDILCREEQPVRQIEITKSNSPHAIILMENGMIEIQSYGHPSDYSSELLDDCYFQSEEELKQENNCFCRPWDIEDDLNVLTRPKKSISAYTANTNGTNTQNLESNIGMNLTIERLKVLMPELWKPTHEQETFLTLDGNLLAPPTKRQVISNNPGQKKKKQR